MYGVRPVPRKWGPISNRLHASLRSRGGFPRHIFFRDTFFQLLDYITLQDRHNYGSLGLAPLVHWSPARSAPFLATARNSMGAR